jgi:hypothetical protein
MSDRSFTSNPYYSPEACGLHLIGDRKTRKVLAS